jgi:hypothetical protein
MVDVAARCSFTLPASIPEFTAQDVRAVQLPAAGSTVPELRHWTALYTRRDGLDHVRVDFLSTIVPGQESARPAVRIAVGETEIDVGADRNEPKPASTCCCRCWTGSATRCWFRCRCPPTTAYPRFECCARLALPATAAGYEPKRLRHWLTGWSRSWISAGGWVASIAVNGSRIL